MPIRGPNPFRKRNVGFVQRLQPLPTRIKRGEGKRLRTAVTREQGGGQELGKKRTITWRFQRLGGCQLDVFSGGIRGRRGKRLWGAGEKKQVVDRPSSRDSSAIKGINKQRKGRGTHQQNPTPCIGGQKIRRKR